AIDFVVGQRDDELWGRLIDWALGSPDTTGALLDCIGGYVDPLLLVRRIPRGMRVERLRDRLRAIIADYRTQTSLREGCNAILRSDCRHLLAKLYDGTRRVLPYVYVNRPGGGGEAGQWSRWGAALGRSGGG
ncbi:Vacuolar protein sorting-associated protein 41, partial [Tetrabaena socialis]